jgi:serine/arginine repetitive matrix protein 1
MSGGFFRGTSADQDTRFSNKMKKLLKSQKFAPELDVLVDMTKVKVDVIRPWIATRVTELLGFEDEVLINFIYGMLDGKEVDGKHVQIQLTGFMEKNTGRFMKELWILLTSAQKNLSGIPQEFLDVKAEEQRLKKAENDRIVFELQRKREQEKEAEQERLRELDAARELEKSAGGGKNSPTDDIDMKSSEIRKAGHNSGRGSRYKTSLCSSRELLLNPNHWMFQCHVMIAKFGLNLFVHHLCTLCSHFCALRRFLECSLAPLCYLLCRIICNAGLLSGMPFC